MKRFLRWAGRIVIALIVVTILGVGAVWGYYHRIVSAKPGLLKTEYEALPMGALVNSFSGTGGYPWVCGNDTPAATVPHGMVRLAPDTGSPWKSRQGFNRSGYYYGDNKIVGFSHTRLVGADAHEGGLFRVFPALSRDAAQARSVDRSARFSHDHETAFPGYYAVRLRDSGVLAEMTTTRRTGVHRYTFPADEESHIIIDVTSALGNKRCGDGRVKVLPDSGEVEGSAKLFGTFSSRYGGLKAYFVARFSRPFDGFGTWNGDGFETGRLETTGDAAGLDVWFSPSDKDRWIEVRVGLSYVSIANARLNLNTEAGTRTFSDIVRAAQDEWEAVLGRVKVAGGTEEQRRIFYTRLYNSFMMPTTFSDVNGDYTGFDRAVHAAQGFTYYTDMSLWDTFRTVHPLYTLIARPEERDMVISLVEMAKAGGSLPRWPSGAGYTGSMLGSPADMVVAEAWLKGIRDFDVEAAYGFMRETAMKSRPDGTSRDQRDGIGSYVEKGYCPSDEMEESVASTLEFAHADHAIGLLAQALGRTDDATYFLKRGQNYRNVWNPESLYFEERDGAGRFPKERNPLVLSYLDRDGRYTRGYVEGSGLQWRWYVPHDAAGLVSLFPSEKYFTEQLDSFFSNSDAPMGHWYPGVYYWHGNQPDLHSVYLFNAVNRPDLTQKWVRWILSNRYADNYSGIDGNDDGGTLSTWYVFSSLGLYPIAGTTRYELGAPTFDSAELDLGDHVLRIEAEREPLNDAPLVEVWLNNNRLDRTWVSHEEIAGGGVLRFKKKTG